MANLFFIFQKQKIPFQISKTNFSQIFYGGITDFFLDPRLTNLFKIYNSYIFAFTKIVIYCVLPYGGGSTVKELSFHYIFVSFAVYTF